MEPTGHCYSLLTNMERSCSLALEHILKQIANQRHVFRSQLGKILLSTLILCCQTMATWMESRFRPGEPIRALKDYLDRLDCPGWQPDVAQRCPWSTRRDAELSLRLLSPCWARFGRVSARATELCERKLLRNAAAQLPLDGWFWEHAEALCRLIVQLCIPKYARMSMCWPWWK